MITKLQSYFVHVTTGPYSLFECMLLIKSVLNNMRPMPNMYNLWPYMEPIQSHQTRTEVTSSTNHF